MRLKRILGKLIKQFLVMIIVKFITGFVVSNFPLIDSCHADIAGWNKGFRGGDSRNEPAPPFGEKSLLWLLLLGNCLYRRWDLDGSG
jgi:hypothetical protein